MSTGADVNSFAVLHDWYAALAAFRSDGQDATLTRTLTLAASGSTSRPALAGRAATTLATRDPGV